VANGCGVVTTSGFRVNSDAGALADGPSNDGVATVSLDASSCQPADVETYVPGEYHPATAAWQGVCSTGEITAFYDACLAPGTSSATACSAFSAPDAAGSACAACIVTPDSASAYGPLISHGTFITNNVAGCIQLTLPSELSCAKAEAALVGCELAACEANCPVDDAPSRTAYNSCASAADTAGCQSYEQMAECAQSLTQEEAGAASVCLPQSFEAFYYAVVPRFCGSPSEDAGTVLVEASAEAESGADGGAHDATTVESGPN
jgi:hypothetical protein